MVRRERGGPVAVIGDMWQMTKQTAVALIDFPVKVYYTAYNLVTGKPRDIYGPMSIVGASRAAGEIAATNQISAANKTASLFTVLASVNLFSACFISFRCYRWTGSHGGCRRRRGQARLGLGSSHRPDPGYVDTARMLPIAYVVGGIILVSGVAPILADILYPIRSVLTDRPSAITAVCFEQITSGDNCRVSRCRFRRASFVVRDVGMAIGAVPRWEEDVACRPCGSAAQTPPRQRSGGCLSVCPPAGRQ